MRELNRLCLTFLKKSRLLTISCIVCVFFACSMLVLMVQLTDNSKKSFIQSMRDLYGDCDILASREDYSEIDDSVIGQMSRIKGVDELDSGYWNYTKMSNSDGTVMNQSVYTIGTDGGSLNKGRYRFVSDIGDNQIVINDKMSKAMELSVGDTVVSGNFTFNIIEIIYDDNFSYQNMLFAVTSRASLCRLLENKECSNFILVKRDNTVTSEWVKDEMEKIDDELDIMAVEDSAEYISYIRAFSVFMGVLEFILICISGLFIASVFRSFMQKYCGDMTVIRTIGGSPRQVRTIFSMLGVYITAIGCVGGLVFSCVAGHLLFDLLADRFDLVAEARQINVLRAVIICAGIFIIIEGFLITSVKTFLKELPFQSMRNNGYNNRVYSGKSLFSRLIVRLLRRDHLISYKMAVPRMKENVFMILIILLLTSFSYIGENIMHEINKNNEVYYRSMYLDEVMISEDQSLKFGDIKEVTENLKEQADTEVFCVTSLYTVMQPYWKNAGADNSSGGVDGFSLSSGGADDLNNDNVLMQGCGISELKQMEASGLIKNRQEDYSNCILVNNEFAENNNLKAGDSLTLYTTSKATTSVTIVGFFTTGYYGDVILDVNNSIVRSYSDDEEGNFTLFAHEDTELLEAALQNMRWQFPALRWQSYQSIMDMSNKVISQRYFMVRFIIYLLALLAAIGCFNSARNMINMKKDEYTVLRKLGMSSGRVEKIVWRQLLLFVCTGIVVGILLALLVLGLLDYREYGEYKVNFHIEHIWFILAVFTVMLVGLRKTVKGAGRL